MDEAQSAEFAITLTLSTNEVIVKYQILNA